MEKIGTSIVSTEEYIELLEFKKAMSKDFVEFQYCSHRRKFAYSKDDFLKEHKKRLDNLKQHNKDLTIQINDLKTEISQLKKEPNINISKFGWYSFIRGAIFGIGISILISIIYLTIK